MAKRRQYSTAFEVSFTDTRDEGVTLSPRQEYDYPRVGHPLASLRRSVVSTTCRSSCSYGNDSRY